MIKIRLKPSYKISAYFVTLLIQTLLLLSLLTNNARNMSKSTSYTGQPVYSQVIILLDKAQIQRIYLKTLGGERYVSV